MQPSSLIFLVIIAIWAAYFIQHWVRRREHLATARSVDRFSESMRVLEHRAALPVADLSAPQPRSYAVSPARPARPEILVKRADRAPAVAESAAPVSSAASAARAASAASPAPAASGRRARGLTLLGSLASLLVTVGLCAFSVVPWLAVAAPVAATAAVLVWMRQGAKAEQAARRAARAASGRAAASGRPAGDRQVPSQSQRSRNESGQARQERRTVRPAAGATRDEVSGAQSRHAQPTSDDRADADGADAGVVEQPQAVTRESFYDVEAVGRDAAPAVGQVETPAAVQAAPAVPLVDEDDIPLTWDPVPVPRPTYTMKAVAPRTQAPPVGAGVPPELAEPAYEEQVWKVAGA